MTAPNTTDVASELRALRHQVRLLMVLTLGGLLLAVLSLSRPATPLAVLPPRVEVDGGVVLANGFALRDLDGQVRAFLKLIDGAALVLCDDEGRAQVQLHALKGGGRMTLAPPPRPSAFRCLLISSSSYERLRA
jgi:hypothetical protein